MVLSKKTFDTKLEFESDRGLIAKRLNANSFSLRDINKRKV